MENVPFDYDLDDAMKNGHIYKEIILRYIDFLKDEGEQHYLDSLTEIIKTVFDEWEGPHEYHS